jgi:sulfonate transport system substrate-binding protein
VPKGSPLRQLSDLRGKRIAVANGSSAHGVLLNALQRAGLTDKDVQISFLQPAEAYSAFRGGDVDAWFTWDPYTSQAEQETGARILTGGEGLTNGYSFQVANRSALADPGRNAALRDYVLRLARAQTWAQQHPEQRAAAWAADTGLAQPVTLAAARRGADLDIPLDERVVKSEQELADEFADAGIVPGRARFADYVDTRYQPDLARLRQAP